MRITYTLYLLDRSGGRRFQPVLCADEMELMRAARRALEADDQLVGVEAFFGDERILGLSAGD